ncbi:MAG: DUF1080 domain-containing protein [Tannerellaceae bacterium]|nr:DUF1080 domain-containing protein [Tannerellaceae bacterium]
MNSKKIFPILLLLLCAALGGLQAQDKRIASTIAADVLAQMPASNQADYNKQMLDLASAGEEAVIAMAKMLKAPGQGSNAVVEYALNGLASYVSANTADAAARQAIVNAFRKAAGEATVPEHKVFLNDCLRILGVGYVPAAESCAILPKITGKSPVHLRIAALRETVRAKGNEQAGSKSDFADIIKAALKDPSAEYRSAALNFVSAYTAQTHTPRVTALYTYLLKDLPKMKTPVKVEVLDWLGREALDPAKNEALSLIETNIDVPASQTIAKELANSDRNVKRAAAWALVRLGRPESVQPLAALLASKEYYPSEGKNIYPAVDLGKEALGAFRGNISTEVVRNLAAAADAGKIAGLELLAMRRATNHLNDVLNLAKTGSSEVQAAAYLALKNVVGEKDLTLLCGMLETAGPVAVPPLQQAVIASLSSLPVAGQVETVNKRMYQAGEAKKHLYYLPLASTADSRTLGIISEAIENGNPEAKDAAFAALLSWKGAEAGDALFGIASSKTSGTYAARALTRYVELASAASLTPENRLLKLRKAMEIATSDDLKATILRRIGRTGTFLALIYAGEYIDNPSLRQIAAGAVMEIALNHPEYMGANVRALLNKVSSVLDNPDADYQRESIRKLLAEAPAEEGFVSIFNGKDLTGWKGLVENPVKRAAMTPAQLAEAQAKANETMRRDWKVQNGLLLFDGKGFDNLCTEKQYGDFEMYVDWLLDTSGKEADAGIYLRGTPQVQIWDTARVRVGAQVGSGGLYNNRVNPSKPLVVADNKLGEWNTFYVKMVADRVTVYLNGVLVTDNVILENFWDRKLPIFPVEQLELQAHGSLVYYRNIYVKELKRAEPFVLSPEEKKEGFRILFDGSNMHEWTGNLTDYTLTDGAIALVPSEGSGGNLYTKEEFGNFNLRFDFMLTPGANNGLGIRTPMEGDAAYAGMELQILDNDAPVYAGLQPYQYHGSVYGVIAARRGFLKPNGEWNSQEVIANGDNIKITLNGTVILEGNIREASKNGTADKQEHPGLLNKKGHIAFLGHGSEVKFRNIRIKPMK